MNESILTSAHTVRIQSAIREEQKEFQESAYFRNRARERYKIEAKNSETYDFNLPLYDIFQPMLPHLLSEEMHDDTPPIDRHT